MAAPTVEASDVREQALAAMLAQSAPRTARYARRKCRGCDWYHGAWQYLRVLGLVSSPAWHREFYGEELSNAFRAASALRRRPRVLISGTADFSMVEQVWHSKTSSLDMKNIDMRPAGVDITVVDRCPTPLEACKQYAAGVGAPIRVAKFDLLTAKPKPASYDVITTDAFLTRFTARQTADVIAAWHTMLDRRGRVITTVRMHGEDDNRPDPEADIRNFTTRAMDRLTRWPLPSPPDREWLRTAAECYARRMQSSDVGAENSITKAFTDGGFEILHRETAAVEGELFPVSYMRIAARRLA